MLKSGLKTHTEPVPESNTQFDAIVAELAEIDASDVEKKLVVAGYLDHPVEDMRCLECIYYLNHRKWCNLPEINLPAEPEWWCRLWRI
ncbi:MAG: hypothetical protein JSS86_19555 [Cyanobacteria bacterium SZAS LIN-2]|nr:hypothetical protein [Cyanobacteria bacterium SZAS LIN-3]MBS1998535.1 hypothetical protein [Cyanobacteria bacterium SZAS LIN-2]